MAEISSLMALVERILDRLSDGTLSEGFEEPIQRGSAAGLTCVVGDSDDPDGLVLVVRLSIMRAPDTGRVAFYERLFELNHAIKGRAAFSVDADGIVYLTAGRPVEDLDPGEIIDLILWTSEQADRFDDMLLTEFGYEHTL